MVHRKASLVAHDSTDCLSRGIGGYFWTRRGFVPDTRDLFFLLNTILLPRCFNSFLVNAVNDQVSLIALILWGKPSRCIKLPGPVKHGLFDRGISHYPQLLKTKHQVTSPSRCFSAKKRMEDIIINPWYCRYS